MWSDVIMWFGAIVLSDISCLHAIMWLGTIMRYVVIMWYGAIVWSDIIVWLGRIVEGDGYAVCRRPLCFNEILSSQSNIYVVIT